MKKLALVFIGISFVGTALLAQSTNGEYTRLVERVKAIEKSQDSLLLLIDKARDDYQAQPANREKIAVMLSKLEMESIRLKSDYDRAVTSVTLYAQQHHSNQAVLQPEEIENNDLPESYPQKANIVSNMVFKDRLSSADYAALLEADRREYDIVECIDDYMGYYDNLVTLQLEYERVDSQSEAYTLLHTIDSLRLKAAGIEGKIYKSLHSFYDNKIYAYNLMMEMFDKMDLVAQQEQTLANQIAISEQNVENFESEVLVDYYYRKAGLLDYEIKVAEVLELSKAKDSLNRVRTLLRAEDYCLPKVTIKQRSFIKHEPLKVIKPTIYNSHNPIPRTEVYEHGTVYRIRLGIFVNRPNLSALRGITPLSYTDAYHDGRYAYFVGGFRTEEEAVKGVQYLRKLGFRDPLPVMWIDGEYISNIAEWKKTQSGCNIEITGVTTLSDAVKSLIMEHNEACRISRIGSAFIVGTFNSSSEAQSVISQITALDSNIQAEIKPLKAQ